MNFQIEIKKDTSFDYWTQSLVNWSGYFQPNEGIRLLNEGNVLNEILEEIKGFLEDKNYKWLWKKYTGEVNLLGIEDWERIKSELQSIFDQIWVDHRSSLKIWKNNLTNAVKGKDFKDFIDKTHKFLGSNFDKNKKIKIYLLPSYGDLYIGGHSMASEVKDAIILNISGLNTEKLHLALNTLCHEIFHLFYESSESNRILKEKFMSSQIWETNKSQAFLKKSKFLLTEGVLTSLSYKKVSYLDYDKGQPSSILQGIDEEKIRSSEEYQAIYLADILRLMTYKYLDSKKKIDGTYVSFLINSANDILLEN